MDQDEVVLIEDIDDQAYPAPTEQSMGASRDIGISSVIAAPLKARGMKLGVLSLAMSGLTVREDAKHYVADDRDLVAAIASRVAIAIDNAMLFEEERATALAFQDSLLPQQPADAGRYRGRLPVRARRSRWRAMGRASRPRSAATGTTSSSCRPGGSAS